MAKEPLNLEGINPAKARIFARLDGEARQALQDGTLGISFEGGGLGEILQTLSVMWDTRSLFPTSIKEEDGKKDRYVFEVNLELLLKIADKLHRTQEDYKDYTFEGGLRTSLGALLSDAGFRGTD